MSYTIESINGCTKKFIFNFDQIDLSSQIKDALVAKQKSSNLKGFRQGKAPLEIVQKFYGPQIENDALYRFVSEKFYDALKKENLRVIGYPSFGNTKYEGGNKVAFEATIEVFPDFEIKDYSKYTFKKESIEVTKDDLENIKKQYLGPKTEMVEVTDSAVKLTKDMFAVFNFEGEKSDGTKPENMKATEYLLEIGSGQFIPGFEDGMMGMKKGEKKTIEVTFPADYHEEDLKNAKVKFHIDLLEIKEKKFPELNDALAVEFGYESLADFNDKNMKRLEAQKKRDVMSKIQQQILEKLISDNKFDLPHALVVDQKESVKEDLKKTLKQQGFNDQMIGMYFEKWDADITAKAEFQVRSGLMLDKLAKKNNIEATDKDLDKKIDEMVAQSGMSKDEVTKFYTKNENVKRNMLYAIREEKTFEKVISEMKIS